MIKKQYVACILFCFFAPLLEAKNSGSSSSSVSNNDKPTNRERIEAGYRSGQLTKKEYEELLQGQAELKEFREKIDKDGVRTAEERAEWQKRARDQKMEISEEMGDRQMHHSKLLQSLENRIKKGMSDGTLTQEEISELQQQLKRATSLYNSELKDDGRLDKYERQQISDSLNTIRKDIHQERNDTENSPLAPGDCGQLTSEECAEWNELRIKRRGD